MTYFKVLAFYPYTTNSEGKTLLLVRKKNDHYKSFGGHFVESDPSIIYTAARCFLKKAMHLIVPSNYALLESKEYINTTINRTDLNADFVMGDPYTREFLIEFLEKREKIIRSIIQNQMGLFFPVPHFDTTQINACLAESKYVNTSFHFVPLEEITNGWLNSLLPEIDNQLIIRAIPRLLQQNNHIEGSEESYSIKMAIILLDDHQEVELEYETFYAGSWFKETDKWVFYKAWKGELPSDEELKTFKGVVLPGSFHSVYDTTNNSWLQDVFELVRNIRFNHSHIKLVGICFGHQLVAQALGGEVRKMMIDRPNILENQIIYLNDNFYKFQYADKLMVGKKSLYVIESHGDEVVQLPIDAEVTAWSDNTKIEGFKIGDNIMCFQFHPEFSQRMIEFDLFPNSVTKEGDINTLTVHQQRTFKTLYANTNDRMLIIDLIGEFLHN